MSAQQLALIAISVVTIGALLLIVGLGGNMAQPTVPAAAGWAGAGELASLASATEWLNTEPLTAAGLRGNVVLVDVWTYTCINWLRQLPYVRAWADKYRDQGLVVIGVHAPEFPFERDLGNVRRAAMDLNVTYPVAVDNDFAIWRAFNNNYWPAIFLVDAQGRVRYHHFGEGEYEQSERMIQQLLAEAGVDGVNEALVSVDGMGAERAADLGNLRSPETYLGYERTMNFASPGGVARNMRRTYAAPDRLSLNQWALAGDWTIGSPAVVLHEAGGRVRYRFHARDLHFIMGPATREMPVRFTVRIDGQPPGAAHGLDVDADGNGMLTEQRMYQLIRQPGPIADRDFEIEFWDAGVEVYSFTFG